MHFLASLLVGKFRPCRRNDKKFLAKQLKFALQAMFDRLATSQNIVGKAE